MDESEQKYCLSVAKVTKIKNTPNKIITKIVISQ